MFMSEGNPRVQAVKKHCPKTMWLLELLSCYPLHVVHSSVERLAFLSSVVSDKMRDLKDR